MSTNVSAEALKRISAARAVLRIIDAHERNLGAASGDDASRSLKGMLFVHNYAVYEYVVVEAVRILVGRVNDRNLPLAKTRAQLLAMALDPELMSIASASPKKNWSGRCSMFQKVRSNDILFINDELFPMDGSHFRPAQLQTIWDIFGAPGGVVPDPRLRGHIDELVETRNRIAHGRESPATIGGGFSVVDLEKRINDTEAVCSHILSSLSACAANPASFSG